MDISNTIAPKSDQLNADDLMAGPRTVTVVDVKRGNDDQQPVDIHLAEYEGRPFKPCKSMRRVLVQAWGADASAYVGRRMTIYRDASVKFGRDDVGGIRISDLSDIPETLTIPLTITRGRRAPFVVKQLADAPPTAEDWHTKIGASDSVEELRGWWQIATPDNRKRIEARVKQLAAKA